MRSRCFTYNKCHVSQRSNEMERSGIEVGESYLQIKIVMSILEEINRYIML